MLKNYKITNYDFKLCIYLIAISVIGIMAIGSAQESVQSKQILGLIVGVFLMITISLIDYDIILKLYWGYYILNLVLLVLVEFLGYNAGGAQRWFTILGVRFQPSEFAKILLILFYAQFIMIREEKLNSFPVLMKIVSLFAVPLFLIYNQPDLSTSICISIIFCIVLFVAGLSLRLIFSVLAITIPAISVFMFLVMQPDQHLIKDYQQRRILAFLRPSEYTNTEGYQQANSVMAIGSGQLFGKGLNNNVVGSVKNGNFISEPQTDFIFAIVGEELGFIGSAAVIILLFFIAFECFRVARKAKDTAGMIICVGIGSLIAVQSFMNIAVATSLMPNTGIPLPFVSAGLTSLVSLFIGMGVVLNVRLQGYEENYSYRERDFL